MEIMSLSSMKRRATLMTTLEKVEEKKQVEENTKTGASTSQTPGREQRAQSNGVIEDSSLKQSFTKVWARLKKTNKKSCSVQSSKSTVLLRHFSQMYDKKEQLQAP